VAVEVTPLGFKKPNGQELVRNGDNVISDNAQKADDWIRAGQTKDQELAGRIGVAEAKLDAGAGGIGLTEDPSSPGLYYFAGPTFAADPANPGLYLIGT